MTRALAFILGVALGVAVFYLWTRREAIGFAVEHRTQIDGAGQIVEGFKKVFA